MCWSAGQLTWSGNALKNYCRCVGLESIVSLYEFKILSSTVYMGEFGGLEWPMWFSNMHCLCTNRSGALWSQVQRSQGGTAWVLWGPSHYFSPVFMLPDLSPDLVGAFLRDNPEYLDNYVLSHVSGETVERWHMIKRPNLHKNRLNRGTHPTLSIVDCSEYFLPPFRFHPVALHQGNMNS